MSPTGTYCLATKSAHSLDHLALLRTAHSSEKRKAQETIR